MEEGLWGCLEGAEILGVWVRGGFFKIGEVKGEGVKFGYKTMGVVTWAGSACFTEIVFNATTINFAISWQQSQPG